MGGGREPPRSYAALISSESLQRSIVPATLIFLGKYAKVVSRQLN